MEQILQILDMINKPGKGETGKSKTLTVSSHSFYIGTNSMNFFRKVKS